MTSTMSNFMELQIKSLEQQTFPITISRNASVSDLKREIKIAVNIDCHRQRLIFQGRVLKDDKQLTHYGNIDNGKVVHLVVRPLGAPYNPENDNPNSENLFQSRSTITGSYAFTTLNSIYEREGQFFRNLFHGQNRNNRQSRNNDQLAPISGRILSSPSTPITLNSPRSSSAIPRPLNIEARLVRTLGVIRNVRQLLNSNEAILALPVIEVQLQQYEELRRGIWSVQTHSAQLALVLNEFASLFVEIIPYLNQLASGLSSDTPNSPLLVRTTHIARGLSFIGHLLGSVISNMHNNNTFVSSTNRRERAAPLSQLRQHMPPTMHPSLVRLPSYLLPPENRDVADISPSTSKNRNNKRSPLSSSSTSSSSSSKKQKLEKKEDNNKDKKGKQKDEQK